MSYADEHYDYQAQQDQDEHEQSFKPLASRTLATTTQKETKMNSPQNINDMSFDQLVPSASDYLKKDDAGEDGVILTIKGFKHETIKGDNGDEEKLVMYFVEEDYKPMIINRTNAQLIPMATGAKTAGEARGKQIVVYNDPTISFGGKVTGGLRVKKVAGAPKQAQAPKQAATVDPDGFPSDAF